MKSSRSLPKSKFTFTHSAPLVVSKWKRLLLWALRIPAYDILFFGITGTLGTVGLWLVQALIAPQPGSQASLVFFNEESSFSKNTALLLTAMAFVLITFWIAAAYFTRRAVLWVVHALRLEHLTLVVQIGLLCIGWLPLITVFALQNLNYSSKIISFGAIALFLGSILFILESLLLSYWDSQKSS